MPSLILIYEFIYSTAKHLAQPVKKKTIQGQAPTVKPTLSKPLTKPTPAAGTDTETELWSFGEGEAYTDQIGLADYGETGDQMQSELKRKMPLAGIADQEREKKKKRIEAGATSEHAASAVIQDRTEKLKQDNLRLERDRLQREREKSLVTQSKGQPLPQMAASATQKVSLPYV